jgi:hypothetical protein
VPRPTLPPFPLPARPTVASLRLRRRLRRVLRSRLAWWLCALAVGVNAATGIAGAEADLARARASCEVPDAPEAP